MSLFGFNEASRRYLLYEGLRTAEDNTVRASLSGEEERRVSCLNGRGRKLMVRIWTALNPGANREWRLAF